MLLTLIKVIGVQVFSNPVFLWVSGYPGLIESRIVRITRRQNSRKVPNREARYKIPNCGNFCKDTIGVVETIVACNQRSLFAVDMGSNPEISFFFLAGRTCLFGNALKLAVENLDGYIKQIESLSY